MHHRWITFAGTLGLASCGMNSGGGPSGNKPAARTAASSQIESRIREYSDSYRKSNGMEGLKRDATLDRLAREHSRDMLLRSKVDHRGTSARFDVATAELGVNGKAENVYRQPGGGNAARAIVNGWIASSGHLKNLRGPWTLTGVGIETDTHGTIWATQIYASVGPTGMQAGPGSSLSSPMRAW
jgi:uncharacterized protein YkwD